MATHSMEKSSLDMGNLPSNSAASKEKAAQKRPKDAEKAAEKPREIEKVISSEAKVAKKPAGKRFLESIGVEDGRTVGDYLLWDVLLPAMKDTVSEVVKKGIDVFLYGSAKPSNVERRGSTSRVSYGSYYSNGGGRTANRPQYRPSRPAYQDVVFDDRHDAEMVLSEMVECIDQYGFVKVSDLYGLAGLESSYTDQNFGWDQLGTARVERVRDGYALALPRPIPVN